MMRKVSVRMIPALVAMLVLQPSAGWSFPDTKSKWIRVSTENFTLVSNAKAGKVKEMGLQLERFRASVERNRGVRRARSHLPTTILVFKNEKSYRPYKLDRTGKPDNTSGKFVQAPAGNFISIDGDAGDEPFSVIFHEYIHYIKSKEYADVPLWLNEGMAEFYSTFWTEDETVEIGRPVEDHVQFLGQQRLMSLAYLFDMDTSSKDYNEGLRQGIFYAQSWALYHYLYFSEPNLMPSLEAFLDNRNSQTTIHEAFTAAFGMDYEDLEATLRRYVANGRFNHLRIKYEDLGINEAVQVEPMPYAELLLSLGDYLHYATPWQANEAKAHFREALRIDPGNAAAHASLAAVLEAAQQLTDAERHYGRAIELAPDDARIHYLCGMARANRFLKTRPMISLRPETFPRLLGKARPLLERCVLLSPNWGDAHAALGNTYLFDPDHVEQGIATLRYAASLMPNRLDIIYGQVILNLRAGNHELAAGLVNQVLVRTTQAQLLTDARQMLEYDKKLRQIDMVNAAIDKANKGDYAGAIATLEHLLQSVTDVQQERVVRKYLEEFQAAKATQQSQGR